MSFLLAMLTNVVGSDVEPPVAADVLGYGADVLGYGDDEVGYGTESESGTLPVTSGLRAYYDADAITGLADGDAVAQWGDQSGAALHLTQGTAANQPSYHLGVLNGMPVVRFDGNDLLDAPAFTSALAQPNTIFVVGKISALGGGVAQIFIHGQSGGFIHSLLTTAADEFAIFAGTTLAGGAADTGFHVISGLFDGGSSQLWVDGTSVVGPGNAGVEQYSAIRLGASAGGTALLTGDIAEVLVYDRALTAQERQDVEDHLATKWGL